MRISLLGPTNLDKFCAITNLSRPDITRTAQKLGAATAAAGAELVVVFNYAGMLKLIGDAHKKAGGTLTMLYAEQDADWETKIYLKNLSEASTTRKTKGWHEMLYGLVTDSDAVVCAGLSAGVFVELGYMKWSAQDKRGKARKLICIKELLRDGGIPPEISMDLQSLIQIISASELPHALEKLQTEIRHRPR